VSKPPRKAGQPVQITTTAPDDDLRLRCSCDGLLTFVHSTVGGVVPVEYWDRYVCHRCSTAFEYRRRTRRLRRVA
jgi:hypothetical protein